MSDLNLPLNQVGPEVNVASKHEMMKSVKFPLSDDAKVALERIKHSSQTGINYVQLVYLYLLISYDPTRFSHLLTELKIANLTPKD